MKSTATPSIAKDADHLRTHGRRVTRTEHRRLDHDHRRQVQWQEAQLAERRGRHPNGSIWFTDPAYGIGGFYEGIKADASSRKRKTSTGWIRNPAMIKMVVDDFVKPNGICFSPDEKKLYICDTGFTDGPDNPSHIRVFDVGSRGPESFRTARSLPTCAKPSITDGAPLSTPKATPVVGAGGLGRPEGGRRAHLHPRRRAHRQDPHPGNRRQCVLRRQAAKPALHCGSTVAVCGLYGVCRARMKPLSGLRRHCERTAIAIHPRVCVTQDCASRDVPE